MSDDVASRSSFLCMYMSNHPDTLVAYVRHFGKIQPLVESASMTSINSKAMSLSYVLKGSKEKGTVNVPFEPPLSGYDEVKPRLLSMKLDAEESLGMVKRPQITTFEVGPEILTTLSLIALFIFVTFSEQRPYSTIHNIGPWLRNAVGGPKVLKAIWIIAYTLHFLEAVYVFVLCRRHSTGFVLGAKWVTITFLAGYPGWSRLKRLIQKARIDSITKIH